MGVSLILPRMMPGFLPFLVAVLAPVISIVLVWSTRDLGEVVQPSGLDEARAVLNACPIPLIILDFRGKLRFVNRECAGFGIPTGENPGPSMVDVLHENDVESFKVALEVMGRKPDTVEQVQVRMGTGEAAVPVVAQMARLKNWDRVVVCLMEPVELPSTLADESREYQLKMDTICHGIQGPMVGISGVVSALVMSIGEDRLSSWMEQLQDSSGQLAQNR
jgi:nitrogen-specific signal transduction histidine kinase